MHATELRICNTLSQEQDNSLTGKLSMQGVQPTDSWAFQRSQRLNWAYTMAIPPPHMPSLDSHRPLLVSMMSSRIANCPRQDREFSVPADWLMAGQLQKMVLVITSSKSQEVLERWTFDLQTDKTAISGG